jgi:hypothetical protein
MQLSAQPTFPTLPTRPNCLVWYEGDPCDQLIQQYHQASQLRQQQEWQNSVTSPFLKQIADQQKQIAAQQNQIQALQIKIEAQTATALQSEARNQEVLARLGAGLGATLALLVAIAAFRRFTRNRTTGHLSSASSR